jgi:hypothetical protein
MKFSFFPIIPYRDTLTEHGPSFTHLCDIFNGTDIIRPWCAITQVFVFFNYSWLSNKSMVYVQKFLAATRNKQLFVQPQMSGIACATNREQQKDITA